LIIYGIYNVEELELELQEAETFLAGARAGVVMKFRPLVPALASQGKQQESYTLIFIYRESNIRSKDSLRSQQIYQNVHDFSTTKSYVDRDLL
jgi:hypothetical protein